MFASEFCCGGVAHFSMLLTVGCLLTPGDLHVCLKVAPADPTKKVAPPTETKKADTTPPESIFKNLKPSEHRYSLRDRDEL